MTGSANIQGIILSTSFIHLLYEGLITFANPCVGNVTYDPTAPAIALAGAFITFILDFAGIRQRMASVKRQALKSEVSLQLANTPQTTDQSGRDQKDLGGGSRSAVGIGIDTPGSSKDLVAGHQNAPVPGLPAPAVSADCCHADLIFQAEQGWQVMLLEAGIIFHS
jgi:zinc transporter 1/2/3